MRGRNSATKVKGMQLCANQRISHIACRPGAAGYMANMLSIKLLHSLSYELSISRILDKGLVGSQFGRREREDSLILRKAGAGIGVASLVRPQIVD